MRTKRIAIVIAVAASSACSPGGEQAPQSVAAGGQWETLFDGSSLSAVIETTDGAMSYWALAHPSAKPDFHHPDSFVLDLP